MPDIKYFITRADVSAVFMMQQRELVSVVQSDFECMAKYEGVIGSVLQPPWPLAVCRAVNPFASSQLETLARHICLHLGLYHRELGFSEDHSSHEG